MQQGTGFFLNAMNSLPTSFPVHAEKEYERKLSQISVGLLNNLSSVDAVTPEFLESSNFHALILHLFAKNETGSEHFDAISEYELIASLNNIVGLFAEQMLTSYFDQFNKLILYTNTFD